MTIGFDSTVSCKTQLLVAILGSVFAMSGCKSGGGQTAPSQASATSSAAAPVSTPNQAPTISGSPGASVTAGQKYTFVPVANDTDGDTLGFSVDNRPSWATFDTATGRLTGTPTANNVGAFAGIRISVSDGKATIALPVFTLNVTSPAALAAATVGTAALAWTAPDSNTDGTPLVDLKGYTIRYGTSASALTQTITINDSAQTSYQVTGLTPATYFFAVQSFNNSGAVSELSAVASKTII